MSVTALVDGAPAPVLQVTPVKEVTEEARGRRTGLTAYLVQIQTPAGAPVWDRCELRIQDREGGYGAAAIFRHPA